MSISVQKDLKELKEQLNSLNIRIKDTSKIYNELTDKRIAYENLIKSLEEYLDAQPSDIDCKTCDCDIFCVYDVINKDRWDIRSKQIDEKERLEKWK